MLDLEMVVNDEDLSGDLKTNGKKPVDPHVTCVVYSCQGKAHGVLF